ncbi:hypothetical protein KKF92_00120, partial [Patescibacteria group bacterium]|nr:hypothetical protein [Patescibacteria group bacterium]
MRQKMWLIGFSLMMLFLVWSRFFLLGTIPAIIPHDEMVYAVQAKSYAIQGVTLLQNHSFWQLTPFDPMYAELPATIMSLGFKLTQNPLIASHLISALMGVTLPLALAWLTFGIWGQKKPALAVLVLAVFNPLLWQFSRLGYDAFYSLWFYTVGGALLLSHRRSLKLLSLLFFSLGFFNYQGFKLLLLPWIFLLMGLKFSIDVGWSGSKKWLVKTKNWFYQNRLSGVIFLLLMGLVAYYGLILLPSQPGVAGRLNHTIFSQPELVSDQVDWERRLTLSSPLTSLFSNKPLYVVRFLISRLSEAFNPALLFLLIEPSVSGFSVWTHGIFYFVEGVWMMLGPMALTRQPKWRWSVIVLLLGVVVCSLPTLINTGSEWHLLRTMLSYTLLLILAGWGLVWTLDQKWWRWPILAGYIFLIANFTHMYFNLYPIISMEWGNFEERVVSNYAQQLAKLKPNYKITVYAVQPDYYFWTHLLFANQLNQKTADEVAKQMREGITKDATRLTIGNITFTNVCQIDPDADVIITETDFYRCIYPTDEDVANSGQPRIQLKQPTQPVKPLKIVAPMDSGQQSVIVS